MSDREVSETEAEEGKRGPHPIDVHVGQRVRARRKMLGMSQTQLGVQLGVTFQQVQKYERGTNRIGSSRLFQMSTTLDVPVAYFFEGAETKLPGYNASEQNPADHFEKSAINSTTTAPLPSTCDTILQPCSDSYHPSHGHAA